MAITTIEASDQISDSRSVINANFSDLDTTKLDTDGDASSLTGLTKAQVDLSNVKNVEQIPLSYLDNDPTLSFPSSVKVPSTDAIKTYVDNNLNGLKWKEPVVAATAAAGTLATSFANGQVIDTSITLATGNRILIKDQVDKSQNGIYVVKASGAPDRASDANDDSELPGASCLVSSGTANANKVFTCSDSVVEIGVSDINFVAVSGGASVYTAGTGLSLTGNTFSVDSTVANLTGVQTLTNKTLTAPVISSPTGIVKANVGLGNVDNTSDATKNAATATLTNKTINSSNNTMTIKEAALSFTDITTANASSTKHGLCPKLTNTGAKYLRDDGTFALPPAGSGDCIAPATNTADYIPQWNGADSKTLKNGIPTSTFAPALGADDNYVTNAEKTVIGNTSGTNSGDNATNSQYSGLAASKENTANKENTTMDTSTTKFPTNRLAKEYSDTKLPLAGGTMSGDITLGENTSMVLDPALSADGKYTGLTRTGTAGAALSFGDLCYLDPTDSRWELADANIAAGSDGDARGILGICVLAAANDGDATKMLLYGTVRADTAFPALTINAPAYVSETAGDIVVTQPTTADVVIRVVGYGLTADELFFCPSVDYITHS